MLIIYTGNGKGKTSACVGQAIRAYGNEMRVCFAQFMKSDQYTGEQKCLKNLLEEDFFIGGKGFFTNKSQYPIHREASLKVLAWAKKKIINNTPMLILDECLYALKSELVTKEEILDIINLCNVHNTHLVLSGRGLPDWLIEVADIVSEIAEVKHAYHDGTKATKGIEF